MSVHNPITHADLVRFETMLTQGRKGVDQFYRELDSRGFASAAWSLHEYRRDTDYGAASAIFFNKQNKIELDQKKVDKLYIDTARATVKFFSEKIKNNSFVNKDLTYRDSKEIRDAVFTANNYKGTKWLFDAAMQVEIARLGEEAAEKQYQQWIDNSRIDRAAIVEKSEKQIISTNKIYRSVYVNNGYTADQKNIDLGWTPERLKNLMLSQENKLIQKNILDNIFKIAKDAAVSSNNQNIFPFRPNKVEEVYAIIYALENNENHPWLDRTRKNISSSDIGSTEEDIIQVQKKITGKFSKDYPSGREDQSRKRG